MRRSSSIKAANSIGDLPLKGSYFSSRSIAKETVMVGVGIGSIIEEEEHRYLSTNTKAWSVV
jgi:hypothetical protein